MVMARAGNVQQMEIQSIVPLSPVGTPTTTEKALEMVVTLSSDASIPA